MRTQIRSDASSCEIVANLPCSQGIADLDARDFWCAVSGFGQFLVVSDAPTFCLAPSQNSNVVMFDHTLNLISISQLAGCVDVAGRKTWQFCWLSFSDRAKTTLRNFRRVRIAFSCKLPRAKIVLFVGSYSAQNFLRRSLLTRPRK